MKKKNIRDTYEKYYSSAQLNKLQTILNYNNDLSLEMKPIQKKKIKIILYLYRSTFITHKLHNIAWCVSSKIVIVKECLNNTHF
jgi:hypothetical protein